MLIGLTIWITVASLITGSLYVWDKRASIKDRRRVSEKTLLFWSVLGGWPGGLLAGRWVRHKTRKASFRIRFVVCIIVNLVVIIAIFAAR